MPEWFDRGTDVVNTATNAVLGVVKGDGAGNGKIAVESDGSMAVNGWSENVSNIQLSTVTADTADNVHGVMGILPIVNSGTGRTDGRSYIPAGIIVFTASYNPERQKLVLLDGQRVTNAYVAGDKYYDLAQCFPSTAGGFVKLGNDLLLPNYHGLFMRGSGSRSITEYGFSGIRNGGNTGDKHGDAMRNITGEYGSTAAGDTEAGFSDHLTSPNDSRGDSQRIIRFRRSRN
jgi:hypothetical protein